MKGKRTVVLFVLLLSVWMGGVCANPIKGLLERIDEGASRKFVIELKKGDKDFFELDQKGKKVVIRGNTYVNIATGLNWYLKYYAGINLTWNGMTAELPDVLPPVEKLLRKETDLKLRYDFNYCTYSYTMAFWDWKRWEQEIDWMALHGINLPLAAVGMECVWRNMLLKLGYTNDEVNQFIAGPAFLAWWAMNNLEGWGGPNPDTWYAQQEALQKQILKRMKEYGIMPVFPGYSGMVPNNADVKLGLDLDKPELWNGFTRPAFLQPTDPRYSEIAALYYEEQKKLFSYFVPVRGMSEQIVEVLDNDRRAQREGTSKTGNLLVVGRKGSGKTVLAVDIVKAIQKQRNLKQGKVAIVTGESLNKKELTNIIQKLRGGAIIIEKAGKLNSRTIKELNYLMEKKTGELLFVLEDQRKPLERMLAISPEFKKKFTSKLELPVFINDELVTFGQTYAKENGYKLDEMGILALYSRIDVMQREDHAVSVAEVKEIMDEAIDHSQKANVKHLARRVFKKGTDDSDRIILKEEDFKI